MPNYKFRAECQDDVFRFLKVIDCRFVNITRPFLFEVGYPTPDCEVTFNCNDALRSLVKRANGLVDCHAIAETIKFEADYSGERTAKQPANNCPV
jgi:hypothetical protein